MKTGLFLAGAISALFLPAALYQQTQRSPRKVRR